MRARVLFVSALCAVSLAPIAAFATTPAGYRIAHRAELISGVEHLRFEHERPDVIANVAKVSGSAPAALRPVPALRGNGPALERTSAICQRTQGCLVAVNGDFALGDEPVGALVVDGVLVRSPNPSHHNLMIGEDGSIQAGVLGWRGRVVGTDLAELRLSSVNRERGRDDLVLYTPARGSSTRTNRFGVEMTLRFVRGSGLALGTTSAVRIVSYRRAGDTKIPPNGAVLSGHGRAARALRALWSRTQTREAGRQLLLRVDTTPPVRMAVGGTPILVRDSAAWFADNETTFVRARSPRTVVGWNEHGDLWLVTIDGRQAGHSAGASLAEAADFMLGLGATDALNLDGGGSSTFVVGGAVVNQPSDRLIDVDGQETIVQEVARGIQAANVERPVANALVLVASDAAAATGPGDRAEAAQALELPIPTQTDPASNPAADLPAAIAFDAGRDRSARARAIAPAALLIALVVGAHLRRRSWSP